ncbi:hypothetical protein FRC07_009441, partial [Ceratobasidium sp. 392]
MFPVSQSPTSGANNRITNKPSKKQQAASKRLTVQDFQLLLQAPAHADELLRQYVGADSRYMLAATHAGIFVRMNVRASDLSSRLKEATTALTCVRDFIRFVLSIPKHELKPEQQGFLALRVSYSALTALLGDFSGDADVHAGDPQAPIVSRSDLPTFRHSYLPVAQIMIDLSAELGTSVNTYKHRRSPSPSVVLKLEVMLRTLEVWNDYLRDSTFTEPTRIIRTWLENHPEQVMSAYRTRPSTSGQPSPSFSDRRPSPPGQYEMPLFPPYGSEMFGSSQPQLTFGHAHGCGDTTLSSTTAPTVAHSTQTKEVEYYRPAPSAPGGHSIDLERVQIYTDPFTLGSTL